jgi:hypothetical protein
MASRPQPKLFLVASLCAFAVCLPAQLQSVPQDQTRDPGFSAERVVKRLKEAPAPRLPLDRPESVATYRVTVEQHRVMLSFQEQLQKEFTLTDFQRQSQEWRSNCCGIHIARLVDRLDKVLRRREVRRLREQIARELAQIEANKRR